MKWFPKRKWLIILFLFRAIIDANNEGCGQVWSVLPFQVSKLITWGFTWTKLLQGVPAGPAAPAVLLQPSSGLSCEKVPWLYCPLTPPASVQAWTWSKGYLSEQFSSSYISFAGQLDIGDKLSWFYDAKTEERCKWCNSCKLLRFWFVCSQNLFCLECHTHLKLSWV